MFPMFFLGIAGFYFFLVVILSRVFFATSRFLLPKCPAFLRPCSLLGFPYVLRLLFSAGSRRHDYGGHCSRACQGAIHCGHDRGRSGSTNDNQCRRSRYGTISFYLYLYRSLVRGGHAVFVSKVRPWQLLFLVGLVRLSVRVVRVACSVVRPNRGFLPLLFYLFLFSIYLSRVALSKRLRRLRNPSRVRKTIYDSLVTNRGFLRLPDRVLFYQALWLHDGGYVVMSYFASVSRGRVFGVHVCCHSFTFVLSVRGIGSQEGLWDFVVSFSEIFGVWLSSGRVLSIAYLFPMGPRSRGVVPSPPLRFYLFRRGG